MGILIAVMAARCVCGVTPMPAEMDDARQWVAAKFGGCAGEPEKRIGIEVLANHGPLQANARGGKPMRLGGQTFTRGLYAHAPSRLVVHLPEPGMLFEAIVGVDTNDQTSGGRGSVGFSMQAGNRSWTVPDILREGMPGVPVSFDMGGATELELTVGDGGDGNACDQADWLNAAVTMASGKKLDLGDLPIWNKEASVPLNPAFSFDLDGKPCVQFGNYWAQVDVGWGNKVSSRSLDAYRTEYVRTFTNPETGIEIRWVAVAYDNFPTVEWTLYFKNIGDKDTPIISNLMALDADFQPGAWPTPPGESAFTLHYHNGTSVNRTDYQPFKKTIAQGQSFEMGPNSGRPCANAFPYFNIEWPNGGRGVIVAVGWPGNWKARLSNEPQRGLRLVAGQDGTHFRLHPGEEVRTPLIVLQFWRGDVMRSQNVWRRWMIAHNIPRRNGQLPPPQMPAVSGNQFPGLLCNEADELRYLDRFEEERIPITHWWMDAGWYKNFGDWTSTGTWEIDKTRFPNGIRAIADRVHAKGKKMIVWFEPERVTNASWLWLNHPDWILGGPGGGLLNLGHRDAWNWLVEHVASLIASEGIDFYRQDFNMDPLPHWQSNDAEDRRGITEIRHVEGYLALWDELVKRHPNLMIDSCASGGHRNDLETMRRAVPLLRSDALFDWTGEQCHTYGFASWIPYWGTGLIDFDAYRFRSCLGLDTTLSCDARRKDLDWDLLRKLTAEWREVAPCFWGDYYPLTPYSLEDNAWIAWQFNRPEEGDGIVQAFRRTESPFVSAAFPLRDLDPDARYIIRDMDATETREATGRELMESGLTITMPTRPQAVVVHYRSR